MKNNKSRTFVSLNVIYRTLGNGGGSVGKAVASDTRDPRFESQHQLSFIYQL